MTSTPGVLSRACAHHVLSPLAAKALGWSPGAIDSCGALAHSFVSCIGTLQALPCSAPGTSGSEQETQRRVRPPGRQGLPQAERRRSARGLAGERGVRGQGLFRVCPALPGDDWFREGGEGSPRAESRRTQQAAEDEAETASLSTSSSMGVGHLPKARGRRRKRPKGKKEDGERVACVNSFCFSSLSRFGRPRVRFYSSWISRGCGCVGLYESVCVFPCVFSSLLGVVRLRLQRLKTEAPGLCFC